MKNLNEIPYTPVTGAEEVNYQMLIRLDALCHMLSSIIEYISTKDNVPTQSNTVEVQVTEDVKVETVVKNKKKK